MRSKLLRRWLRLDRRPSGASLLAAILLAAGLLALSGCASFSAAPRDFLPPQAVAITKDYYVANALRRYRSGNAADRYGASPRQWRDDVVTTYMAAADARYVEFRSNLSRESRGANFGMESASLLLSAGGTIASQGVANVFAAAVAALTGARASLAREVYFERTMPALVAGMEVNRLEAATRILRNLSRPETEYPLNVAILDAIAYGRTGSLDQAIQIVTVETAQQAARQRSIYERIEHVNDAAPAAVLPQLARVSSGITALLNEGNAAEMALVLQGLGLDQSGTLEEQAVAAIRAVQARAVRGTLQAFVDSMRTQHNLELDR